MQYCTAKRLRLPREERSDVVTSLRAAGLSLRAIEAATGISRPTIISDVQVVKTLPPELEQPAPTIGVDGKTYPRRETPIVVTETGEIVDTPSPRRPSGPRADIVAAINRAISRAIDAAQAARNRHRRSARAAQ